MKKDYSLFYFNPLPSWVYEAATFQILEVNQAAIDHYGYSKDEFLAMTIKQLRPKGEVPKLLAAHINIHEREGNIYFGVFTHQKKNGTLIRMEINGHKVDFQNTGCIMVICQDVTEREKMILALQQSEQRLKAASEIARVGYWRLEMDAQTLSWSDQVYEIWGRQKEIFEVSFAAFFETIHPDDRTSFNIAQEAAFAGNTALDFEHRILLPNGSVRWVHEKGRINLDAEGQAVSFEGTVQDISSHKEEEHRLKLLESVITHSTDAVLITKALFVDEAVPEVIYVNDSFTNMTGYSAEEVVGKTSEILLGAKSDKAELARLSKAFQNAEPCEINIISYKKDGAPFWMNFSVSPVANEIGSLTHWIAIARDVTASKTQEIEKEILSQISIIFNRYSNLTQSLQKLCELILNYGDFSFAEVWLPDVQRKKLKLICHVKADSSAETFYEEAKHIKEFSIEEGLQGLVWKKKKPQLLGDISSNKEFYRREAAVKAGFNSVLAVPLLNNTEMVGVLIVGSLLERKHLKQYSEILSRFETFIGAEISRKRLEADLVHLFEALPDLICLTDFERRFIKINDAGCKLLGYQEDEIVGSSFEKFSHPADQDIFTHELKRLKKDQTLFKFENRYLTKTGETIWLSWHCNFLADEGVIYATAKNITDEKKHQELLGKAVTVARIGGWEVDMLQQKITWSKIVHELHETDPETFAPDLASAINFYREDYRKMVAESIETSIATGSPFDFEAPLVTAKGKELWVRAIGAAEFFEGKCLRLYGSFQDIHDRKESAERLQSISDDLPGVTFQYVLMPDGTDLVRSVSKAASKIWGITPNECEANNQLIWDQMKAGGDFEIVSDSITKSAVNGTKWNCKWRNLLPSGELRWHEGFGTPNRMADGSVVFNSMIFDITEEVKAAEELQKSYEEKNLILESIGDGFFAVDRNWIVTYWNKQAENILGRQRGEIVGYNLWDVYADATELDFYRKYHEAMATGKIITFQEFYPTLNKWFEVTTYPGTKGLSVFFKDITFRKETDLKVLQANERFEKVTEATNDAIWDWNIEDNSFYWGNGFRTLFGYDIEKITPTFQTWTNHIHPDDLDLMTKTLHEALNHGDTWAQEYRYLKADGSYAFVADKGKIIRDKNDKPVRMVGAMTDITYRKQYEMQLLSLNESLQKHTKELESKNEQLEQFAFITSHDLQEPLRMISSFLNQLKRKYENELDEKAHQYIHFATDGSKRMKQIILDVLDYSRAGKLGTDIEEVDLNEIIDQYRILRKQVIEEKDVLLEIDELPFVSCYKTPLIQTLHSLLDNAIKYSKSDVRPRICMSVTDETSQWVVKIQDNGIGIDPQFFEKIFIIFQRLHDRDKYGGTGIGLSIAKKNIESWGGKIWLESQVGKGSAFYFTINKQ